VTQWQNAHERSKGGRSFRAIALMGIDLDETPLNLPELGRPRSWRFTPDRTVLIDDASAKGFRPIDGSYFSDADIGTSTDCGGKTATIRARLKWDRIGGQRCVCCHHGKTF